MKHTKLTLKNMIFYGYHGVYAEERKLGQHIALDVEMVPDLTDTGTRDDLESTVNYAEVYDLVKEIVEKGHFNLIEGIAFAILNQLGEKYQFKNITVRVRKPHPPVGGLVDFAEFEVSKDFQKVDSYLKDSKLKNKRLS